MTQSFTEIADRIVPRCTWCRTWDDVRAACDIATGATLDQESLKDLTNIVAARLAKKGR